MITQQFNVKRVFNVWSVSVMLFVLIGAYFGNAALVKADAGHDHGESIESGTNQYPVVTVVRPKKASELGQTVEASGEVLPKFEASIYPSQDGVVESLLVDIGSEVTVGQVIGYLKPNIEQAKLNAELLIKQVQLDSNKERSLLLKKFSVSPGSSVDEITNQELAKIDTELSNVLKSKDSAATVYKAELAKIDSAVSSLETQKKQIDSALQSAVLDVLSSIGSVLYNTTDIQSAVNNPNQKNYYRSELYARDRQGVRQTAQQFGALYNSVHNDKSNMSQNVVDIAISLSKKTRTLAGGFTESSNLSSDDVNDLRSDLNESIDHLLDVSNDLPTIVAEQIALLSEKDQLKALYQEKITRLDGDVSVFQKEKDQQVSQAVFNQINAELDIRLDQAELSGLQQQVSVGRAVRAPFTGVITRRHIGIGDSVNNEKPLFDIVDDSQKFIRFFVTEDALPFISEGLEITYAPHSAPINVHKARIARVSRSVDKETKTILVEAETVPDESSHKILAHMNVRVFIPMTFEQELFTVPLKALDLGDGSRELWVINDAIEAVTKKVEISFLKDDVVYLSSGISENDWIILKSPVPLEENLAVETKL